MPSSKSVQFQVPNRPKLDKDFFTELVSEPVQEFDLSAGSKQGDNVQGTLVAVQVKTISGKICHVVIKSVLPLNQGPIDLDTLIGSKFIADLKSYPKEILMYETILPEFQCALKPNHNKNSLFTKPMLYSAVQDKEGLYDYIALEDLRPAGYRMENKFEPLNFEQVSWVMKGMALFHAVSYSLLGRESELKKFKDNSKSILYRHGWYLENADVSQIFNGLISKMLQLLKENGKEVGRLEKYVQTGYDDLLMGLSKKTGKEDKYFPVLIHGDLWTNNILFKYSHGKSVEDMKFIDYQLARFGTIYEELHYFFFTSTDPEFRKAHLNTSLHIYFQEFSRVLKEEINEPCEPPPGFTEQSLISTYMENWDYGLCYALAAIPYQLGIAPPAHSKKVTSLQELNCFNHSSSLGDSQVKLIDPTKIQADNQKFMKNMEEDLDEATRNSPAAIKRLKEVIDEMVELGMA